MDEELRRLKRADPGDRAARARVLQERLRRGELEPDRLELLAYLGDSAARSLAPDAPAPPEVLEPWLEGLRRWGGPALLRALAAAMRATLPTAERERRPCSTCGSYGQVQVRFAETFDWEPCPDCSSCLRCGGTRRFGEAAELACPECVDLRGHFLVETIEAWIEASPDEPLVEYVLARRPALLTNRSWEDTNRPALRQLCLIGLDPVGLTLSVSEESLPLLATHVTRHVLDLDRVAQPRGCVGDAVVDSLHAWAD